MNLMDALDPEQRARFETAAHRMQLRPGEYLVRQGDPGGDLYVLESGTLEAMDRRRGPDVVFEQMHPGQVVGEVAFLDGSPRSADVRALTDAVLLQWDRDDLRSLLDEEPRLAARFHEFLAHLAVNRVRQLTTRIGPAPPQPPGPNQPQVVKPWVDRVANHLKHALAPLESLLRSTPDDADAEAGVGEALDELERKVHALFSAMDQPAATQAAAEELRNELRPYLARSGLMEHALRRRPGVVGTAEVVERILAASPTGEGRLGQILDAWLLQRPTFVAMRSLQPLLAQTAARLLPADGSPSLLVVGAGAPLLDHLVLSLASRPVHLTVLDQAREQLEQVAQRALPPGMELQTVPRKLVQFASGRSGLEPASARVVVVHGVMEYLPEPLAVSLLKTCRGLLEPDGRLVIGTLRASRDQVFLDRVLCWPSIRRSRRGVQGLLAAAGFTQNEVVETETPGHLVVASAGDLATQARSG